MTDPNPFHWTGNAVELPTVVGDGRALAGLALARVRDSVVIVFLALSIAGCAQGPMRTSPEVRVDGGVIASRAWAAWAYRSVDSGICLQIRIEGVDASTLCGIDGKATSIWRPDMPDATFVGGATGGARAVSARITLADGNELQSAVVPATTVSTLRFFVIPVLAGAQPKQLDLLDGEDEVIESITLE